MNARTWTLGLGLVLSLAACGGRDEVPAYRPPDYQSHWDYPAGDPRNPDPGTIDPATGEPYASPWDDPANAPEGEATPAVATFALKAAESCDDVLKGWREAAIRAMYERLRQARGVFVNPPECYDEEENWGYADAYGYADLSAGYEEPVDEGGGEDGSAEGDSASEFSTTNTQEAGVDEADFLKNDGAFIYMLANGRLHILDAWPAAEAHVVSTTDVPGEAKRLYVYNDHAVVFASAYGGYDPYGYGYGDCSYGYGCQFMGDGQPLLISVFDLADKANPRLVRELHFSGSYLNSRRIGDILYAAVTFQEPTAPNLPDMPAELERYRWACADELAGAPTLPEIDRQFDALFEENRAQLLAMDVTDWLPGVSDIWYEGTEPVEQETVFADCGGYYLDQADESRALLSLVSFDLAAPGPLTASSILSGPGAVYASTEALYVAVPHERYGMDVWYDEWASEDEATTIHKFAFEEDAAGTRYVGSGIVEGHVLNQFAMSEYEGNLRIATSNGMVPDPGVHSAVTVLGERAGALVTLGKLDDIAPSEDIRAVRFGGASGYVVTFKKTDPLFVIDLSDPTDPRITGELKIPGFSTYMHFLDPTHLLTIGYDADDQGDFAYFNGIALQVFDVTDGANPVQLHYESIGTRGTSSDAATNHLAFNYFAPREMLAVPMLVCEGGGDGMYGDRMTFNGLMVYRVTVADGFEYVGGIPHETAEDSGEGYYDWEWEWDYEPQCSSWWTESNSTVKRSIFMDEFLYSVALDEIRISALGDLEHPLAILPLE